MEDKTCLICLKTFNNSRKKYCSVECFKEKRKLECKEYKQKNKQQISNYNKNYKLENKKNIDDYNHQYWVVNKNSLLEKNEIRYHTYRKNDTLYKIKRNIYNRYKKFVVNIPSTIESILNCNFDFYITWIEFNLFNFTSEESLENYTKWELDHIIPLHIFDIKNNNEIILAFSWFNTRPLLKKYNHKRKYNYFDCVVQELKLYFFNKEKQIEYGKIYRSINLPNMIRNYYMA